MVSSAGVVSPELKFIFPKDEFEFPVNWPALALVKATSNDSASISKVEFFIGDSLVKTDTRPPYFLRTNSMSGGPFTLTAVATDSEGKETSETLNLSTSFGGISLDPLDDTYVRGGNSSTTNYGLSDVLKVKETGAAFTRRSFLKFDLSSVWRTVNSAILRVRVKREGTDNYSALFVADDTWQEETLTWDTAPITGDTISTSLGAPVEEWMNFDVTSAVIQELNGDKTLSLSLVSDGTSNLDLYSKEAGFGNIPELLINPRNDPGSSGSGTRIVGLDIEVIEEEGHSSGFIIYPNPVDFQTTLSYSLDEASTVQVLVMDVTGKLVANHQLNRVTTGRHTLSWQQITQDQLLEKGVYHVRLVHDQGYFSRKVLVAE
ncbi:DNRLRE domain-containing protein [Fulvivirga sp. M361]|uniref:CBM96 family carbohydrate-binding protein n=1 Tax=Fulvivirga sp. M361 TaxID=2594266 RepID=UPI00351B22B5